MYIHVYILLDASKRQLQVNEKIKKGHIGIVEKVQETSLGTGSSMNCGCVLESRDTPTSHCVTW